MTLLVERGLHLFLRTWKTSLPLNLTKLHQFFLSNQLYWYCIGCVALWLFWFKKNIRLFKPFNIFLNFMHGFKSAILAEWKNCQNGTFEPMHEIQNFFCQKHSFEAIWKWQQENISLICTGSSKSRIYIKNVLARIDFICFVLGSNWIPRRP